jgi:hypothetical protein
MNGRMKKHVVQERTAHRDMKEQMEDEPDRRTGTRLKRDGS